MILPLLLLFLIPLPILAQDIDDDLFETVLQETDLDTSEATDLIVDYLASQSSPLNINSATLSQLQQLPFLTPEQAERLFIYIDRYGPIISPTELLLISSLTPTERKLIAKTCTFGPLDRAARWPELYGQGSILDSLSRQHPSYPSYTTQRQSFFDAYAAIPFYYRKGYRGDNPQYKGEATKHWLRFSYTFSPHLTIGAVAAQDAGEPFFRKPNSKGYDLYSGFLQFRNIHLTPKMKFRSIVVGRYRLRTGLGLAANTSLPFGKLSSIPAVASAFSREYPAAATLSPKVRVTPSLSRTEANSLLGIVATAAFGSHIETTLFLSHQPIDATLSDDSLSIRTLLRTGYHRTESEISRRHNAALSTAGAYATLNNGSFHVGFTSIFNHYNLPLKPVDLPVQSQSQFYRVIAPRGQDFWNLSLDYGYSLSRRFSFHGETATGDCRRIATVNAASIRLRPRLSLTVVQRFYPLLFHSILGQSFSDGGAVQNESGLYLAVAWAPTSRWHISAYTDAAYFPWPKYLAFGSTHSFDNLLQVSMQASSRSRFAIRYRMRHREYDSDKEADSYIPGQLQYRRHHHLRITYDYRYISLHLRSQVDFVRCLYHTSSTGFMLSQQASYHLPSLEASLGFNIFHTTDYNSHIYSYEPSLPSTFALPSFFGRGFHAYTLLSYTPIHRLRLIVKPTFTRYFDRTTIGNAAQQIVHPWQSDIELMFRFYF